MEDSKVLFINPYNTSIFLIYLHKLLIGYWYEEGYIRTSSSIFNIYDEDLYVHLTNDAI